MALGRPNPKIKKKSSATRRAAAAQEYRSIEPAPTDVALDQAAQEFLDTEPQLKALSEAVEMRPAEFAAQAADFVSRATRKQHLKALALAYALWLRASHNSAYENYVATLRRRRPNKRTTDLHLLVQVVVTYGGQDPSERQAKRGLYQRDVAALRYLHHERVGPDDVEERALKPGEGLDTWARRWPAVRNGSETNARVADEVKPGIEIVVRTTAQDGAVTTERYAFANTNDSRRLLDHLRKASRNEEAASQPAHAPP